MNIVLQPRSALIGTVGQRSNLLLKFLPQFPLNLIPGGLVKIAFVGGNLEVRVDMGDIIAFNVFQPADGDLTAVAALSGTGIAARIGAESWALRTLTAPAAGLTITNPAGIAGNPTFAFANDLGAIEALSGTGIAKRTGIDTWALVATLTAPDGGTGQTSYTVGDILYADTAATLARLAAGTSGYALIAAGAGIAPSYQGFIQAGTGAVARPWQAKARDFVHVRDFGAAGDGATNDTTAITNANAAAPAFLSPGTHVTTLAATDLDGPFWGYGQIRTGAINKRAPWFVAVKANSAYTAANEDSIDTAFNGDFSKSLLPVESRITGAATLTQPTSGYVYSPWATPHYTNFRSASGWNNGTADNGGRTAATAYRTKVENAGQGDVVAFNASGVVSGTRSGSTHFLANPAVVLFNGDVFGATDGVYLNTGEFALNDLGFDVAGIGWVVNLNRSNATGAKSAWWAGFRSQSTGSADVNAHFSASGKCDVGLDFSNLTTDASKAAAAFLANDRFYWNASSSNGQYATSLSSVYFGYDSTAVAFIFTSGVKSTSPTSGIGYATGAGGTVTQATNKSTGVTLNKVTGKITMNNAALGAGGVAAFLVTNSACVDGDVVIAQLVSGAADGGTYRVAAYNAGAGSFVIQVTNTSGGSLSEAIVIGFAIIKGVAS